MRGAESRPWRGDIQGLRAVAVLGVLAFHAGVPGVTGGFAGVDVFFVISGFLITTNLVHEVRGTGRVRLVRFFAHRIARLAPAAVVTVAATVAAARVLLPPLDLTAVRMDALAALLGAENLVLARSGTDYLADHTAGPFQQFWSLGVEEQFYLVWALALAGIAAVPFLRRHLLAVTVTATVTSAAGMLVLTPVNGPWAFFGPHTRAWELGVGATLAVWLAGRRAGRRSAVPAHPGRTRWVGTTVPLIGAALVLGSFVLLDGAVAWPSVWTLVPVAGAALLVAPGGGDPVRRVLASAPMRWVGDRSYSLYLWHWPVLTLPVLAAGHPLGPARTAGALGVTAVLTVVSHAVLERRVGSWARRPTRRVSAVVAVVAAAAVAIVPATTLPALHSDRPAAAPSPAAVLAGPTAPTAVPANLTPTIADAGSSLPALYADGCHAEPAGTRTRACSFGRGTATVVLFGDSHAAQWFTPLLHLAEQRHLRLVTMTKSACPSVDLAVRSPELGRAYRECTAWRADALRRIRALAPDLVVLANAGTGYDAVRTGAGPFDDLWRTATARTVASVTADGTTRVLVVHDTPRWPTDPNRCLSASIGDVAACAAPTSTLVRADLVAAERAGVGTSGTTADPTEWICGATCSPVLWNVLAYRDTNHVTDALASALAPRLGEALDRALDRVHAPAPAPAPAPANAP